MFGGTYMPTIVGNLVLAVECLKLAASVRSPATLPSDLGLVRDLEGIVDFNAEVAHRTFQPGMSEQ